MLVRIAPFYCLVKLFAETSLGEFGGQESKTLMERIQTLSDPGAEEARQSHAGRAAFGAARPPTDFASNDQGTHTAFGQIVVRRHAGVSYEHKEFRQKTFDPFAQRTHEGLGLGKRRAHLPEFLFKGVLKRHPLGMLFGGGQVWIRGRSGFGSFVDLLDLLGPLPEGRIVRMGLGEIVNIAQQMHPTALMQALMYSVSSAKIAAQHALELFAHQAFDHFPRARVMILVIAHRWRAHAPNVSMLAIFSPACFICLHP